MSKKFDYRFPLRLDDVTRWKIEYWYKRTDCESRNAFVEKAVNFYADYLDGQQNSVLPTAIQSAIDGRLGVFEDRISKLLYKLTVEIDMGMSAVLDCVQMDDGYLRKLRADSVRNVKDTNFYSGKERQRPPLSKQKEFRSIKNAVIQEAENLRLGAVSFEDEDVAEKDEVDLSALPVDCWELWMVTRDDTAPMEDRDETAAQLMGMANGGDPDAQYLVGKLYQDGPVLIPDSVGARYWLGLSAQRGHTAAQYELGKLLLSNDPEVHDPSLGIQWLECASHNGNGLAAYRLGKEYLKGEIVARDTVKATAYLTQSAEAGNQYAQYALGKLYLDVHDQEQAHCWFTQSALQGNRYAQFFLDREDLKPPSVMLAASRLLHHMSRVFQSQTPTPSVPGGIQIDRKRLAQLREKKIAMGHKADDHEDPSQSWTMTMG